MPLRRQHIIIYLQALFSLLVFTSCSSDKFVDIAGNGHSSISGAECYLTIRIDQVENSSQNRAETYTGEEGNDNENGDKAGSGDFVHGNEDEHLIGKDGNFVIFFDSEKKLFSIEPLTLDDGHKDNPGHNPIIDSDDYIEALYTTKFNPKRNDDGENVWPASCLVVLNGKKIESLLKTEVEKATSLDDILGIVWQERGNPYLIGREQQVNGKEYFTMTNSAYYDNGELQTAVKIKPEHYSSEPNVREDLHIHVERMVAKFSFNQPGDFKFYPSHSLDENTGEIVPNSDIRLFTQYDKDGKIQSTSKKWQVEVTGWNINALETNSYIFKNIENDNYFTNWNDDQHFRSYWSEDPDYTKANYPWQYREPIDESPINSYDEDGSLLQNYSFNQLNLGGESIGNVDYNWTNSIYTPEHTYNANSTEIKGKLDDREELLAGTHLLIGAKLKLEDDNGEYTAGDWFRDRDGYYYSSEKQCFAALVHAFNQQLNSLEFMEFTLYNWDEFEERKDANAYVAKTEGGYGLYFEDNNKTLHLLDYSYIMSMDDETFSSTIGTMAPANLRRGDGKRLPWIVNIANNNIIDLIDNGRMTIKKISDKTPLKICERTKNGLGGSTEAGREIDLQAANIEMKNVIKSMLYEWLGAVDHFKDGKMYYAHGIYNPPLTKNDETNVWGVVRNNWYRFNLTDIKSMGIPVDDPDQPIVPDRVGNEDKINVSIYLLDWHKVEDTISEDNLKGN